tara:strand:+ start:779 stop:1135 length:357 start_codon:yes stop_codon:yes gene_type:complete
VSLADLDSVIDDAVNSYLIAKKRCVIQRHPTSGYTSQDLVADHPDYYTTWGSPKKIKFTGRSAGDIIEDYLEKLGYPRGSDQWFSLAHIVIERGEYESQFSGPVTGDWGGEHPDDGRL